MRLAKSIFLIFFGILIIFSCRKDVEIFDSPSAQLRFSTDSIHFGTVFTTVGTVTKNIRVFNPYSETVKISSIRLAGGNTSAFRMNVDGIPGDAHSNIEIAGKDSMFIFIEATLNPNQVDTPLVLYDQIEFVTNGNFQNVVLEAIGQDAHFITPTSFNRNLPDFTCLRTTCNSGSWCTGPCGEDIPPVNVTWTNDKPYVIYGFLAMD